jgi:hypothetical protein
MIQREAVKRTFKVFPALGIELAKEGATVILRAPAASAEGLAADAASVATAGKRLRLRWRQPEDSCFRGPKRTRLWLWFCGPRDTLPALECLVGDLMTDQTQTPLRWLDRDGEGVMTEVVAGPATTETDIHWPSPFDGYHVIM